MTDIRRPKNITTPKAEVRLDEARGFRGLYAKEPIAKGEVVWLSFVRPEDSDFLSWQDIKDAPEKVRYAYQIAADEFSLSKVIDADRSNYFNHACDPNTWYDESPATKVRAFMDFGLKAWSQDPKS